MVPLTVLFSVVFATSANESVSVDGDGHAVIETTRGVHPAVIVVALTLGAAAAAAAWWWAGRAIRPIHDVTALANQIQAGSLDRRLSIDRAPQEVEALTDSFNAMLERLHDASLVQQRMIEDASHELRTPLAALAANNELIVSDPAASLEEHRAAAQRNDELIDRLQTTIDDLLRDARMRSQQLQQTDNDLVEIVQRVVRRQRLIHPTDVIAFTSPTDLRVGLDGPSVERAVDNLIANAVHFGPPDRPIDVVVTDGPQPSVSVTDHGPGIAPELLPEVFDRYRSDTVEGHGIGLALVKQVADAHAGIDVESPLPDGTPGTRFTMRFRRARDAWPAR